MTKYNLLNPHPKVVEKCMSNGYLPDPFALETTENQIFALMGNSTKRTLVDPAPEAGKNPRKHEVVIHTEEDPQRPIKRTITKVYRLKNTEGEFLYYTQSFEGMTFGGQFVDHSQEVGKYDEPVFTVDVDRATGRKTITGIRKKEPKFEIPFPVNNSKFVDPSTGEQTTLTDLPIAVDCKFYAVNNGKKYALAISAEEFMDKTFGELVEFGKSGKWPAPMEEAPKVVRGKKAD